MTKIKELLVTPIDVDHIKDLHEAGANAIVIGEEQFGLRLAGEFNREDVKKATALAHSLNMNVYVAVNGIFHNDKVDGLYDYIAFLRDVEVDAIIFGDPAVLMIRNEIAPNMPLHWSTETTGTNYFQANYWGERGAKRAVMAKEINMEEIVETKEHANVEIEVQVHGMLCMFQSKRHLLGNYFEYQGKNLKVEKSDASRHLMLYDPERKVHYPIFEDASGTHIMSLHDVTIIDDLTDMLDAGIDSFKIDGVLQEKDYITAVTRTYRKAFDLYEQNPEKYEDQADELLQEVEELQPTTRPLGTGFFYKETIY
ncbi:peptidase U32 family protein [Massilibacterium senegalense]|uniref:peptidase U32 family protein n=1 Tax=Massilibacterium senegalense TaxID=1632858 RepID=UPI000783E807|nr:peptidase U32 family protein [Massilibacterium senegalense]